MFNKIANIIILFTLYYAGKNSMKLKTKKGLTIINNEGQAFINGKWAEDVFLKYYSRIFRKIKIK